MTYKSILLAVFMASTSAVYAQTDNTADSLTTDSVMEKEGGELNEVVVSSRSNRTIEKTPTRVEVLSGEEIDEKSSMKPGDIRMMLNETTGIMTQQTSATSGNSTIRIQGLDGRYTQVLKDGFPAFPGAASGLGLLQTPPLDLRQVEIIKGSTSTQYGGGAIAGLVNLISKTPGDERELTFQANGTTTLGLDLNGFYSERFGKVGTTMFASYNKSRAYDPSDIDFSAIPQYDRWTFNPRLFLYFSPRTTANIGFNTMYENRLGGDMKYIRGHADDEHSYYERNKTWRDAVQLSLNHWITDVSRLNIKASTTYYKRLITLPYYRFNGKQWSSFGEASYSYTGNGIDWVGGLNFWNDDFKEKPFENSTKRNYSQTTLGAFVQSDIDIAKWFSIEAGLRTDYVIDYGTAVLPRLSLLFKPSAKVSSRLGGGLGYKQPTIFTEESERISYRNVLPIDKDRNKLELSWGANWDMNYATGLFDDEISLSINHLFFYTRLNQSLMMKPTDDGYYRMENIHGHTNTKGWETNIKIGWHDFHYYFGWTYTDANVVDNGSRYRNPLTPRHRLNNVLMYEKEDSWKIGLEAYYYSPQWLNDGKKGHAYWLCGFMAEKIWKHISVYINFENMTDRRQTRFDTIYTASRTNPEWRDIYAPLDGFVANGGVKIRI